MDRVTNISWRTTSGARIGGFQYEYDAAERIVSRRQEIGDSSHLSQMSQSSQKSYAYDDLDRLASDGDVSCTYHAAGNRMTSSERGTNFVYAATQLSQYCSIKTLTSDVGLQTSSFSPQFDDDGNQTQIKTATGIWPVTYNGENRPIHWQCQQSNNQTITNNQTISMSFGSIGRRVPKSSQRFVYDAYLQIASFDLSATNSQLFIWDPTEPVATRPLVWNRGGASSIYTHDGNKNVSEVVGMNKKIDAHYEYAPFGAMSQAVGESAYRNFWRFSREYGSNESELMEMALDYYNLMARGRVYNQKSADYSNAATHNRYRNNSLETEGNGGRHFRYVKAR